MTQVVVAVFIGFVLCSGAFAEQAVRLRPLENSAKRPALFYYALDINLPLLAAAVDQEVAAIRDNCEKSKAFDAVFFLQSDYLKKPGTFLLCKDGVTREESLPSAIIERLEKARGLLNDASITEEAIESEWEKLGLFYHFAHHGREFAAKNPYAFEDWLDQALLQTRSEIFPFSRYDHFWVLKGIGWQRNLIVALKEDELSALADAQMQFLKKSNLSLPENWETEKRGRKSSFAFDWGKVNASGDPLAFYSGPKDVRPNVLRGIGPVAINSLLIRHLDATDPQGELAFLFYDSGHSPITSKNTLGKALESLDCLRGYFTSEERAIPYRSVNWEKLLADSQTAGGGAPRLYTNLAEATAAIPTR